MSRRAAVSALTSLFLLLGACSSKYETNMTGISYARVAEDAAAVILGFMGGECDHDSEVAVTETAGAVKLSIRVRSEKGFCNLAGIRYEITVRLQSPLGNRILQDSAGRPIGSASAPPQQRTRPFPVKKITFTDG